MPTNRLIVKGLFLFVLIVLMLLSLTLVMKADGDKVKNSYRSVVIGYSNSPSWWPWIIVEHNNLLKANHLDAELVWYDSYSNSVNDFNAGLIDGNSQLIQDVLTLSPNAFKGKVGILMNNYFDGEDKLIVSKDIKTIEDLKGKTIVAEFGTSRNLYLDLFLDFGEPKISRQDLNIVNLEAGAASAAFAVDEKIDGVVSFPPYSDVALKKQGSHELIFGTGSILRPEISRLLVISQNALDEQPKLIEELRKVWIQALNFISEDSEQANKIIAEHVGIQAKQVQAYLNRSGQENY